MNNSESGYFDFKDSITSLNKQHGEKIDLFEIYLKQALKSNQVLQNKFNELNVKFNKYVDETKRFNDWYNSQSIFKQLKWKLQKRNNEYLIKQFKHDEGI